MLTNQRNFSVLKMSVYQNNTISGAGLIKNLNRT